MLIDITRSPLVLIPDECPVSVIVRAASGEGTKGSVWMEATEDYRKRHKAEWVELPPTETLDRGNMIYVETRLPLTEAMTLTPLASIFEAASVFRGGVWRVRVTLAYKVVPNLWYVTVENVTAKVSLVSVSVKGLTNVWETLHEEKVPLARAKKTMGADMPATIWSRLMED